MRIPNTYVGSELFSGNFVLVHKLLAVFFFLLVSFYPWIGITDWIIHLLALYSHASTELCGVLHRLALGNTHQSHWKFGMKISTRTKQIPKAIVYCWILKYWMLDVEKRILNDEHFLTFQTEFLHSFYLHIERIWVRVNFQLIAENLLRINKISKM